MQNLTNVPSHFFGGQGNDRFEGGNGNDLAFGGKGRDQLNGNGGNDRLVGGDNQDEIYGGEGDDSLGGNYEDDMRGGPGDDRFFERGSYYFSDQTLDEVTIRIASNGQYEKLAVIDGALQQIQDMTGLVGQMFDVFFRVDITTDWLGGERVAIDEYRTRIRISADWDVSNRLINEFIQKEFVEKLSWKWPGQLKRSVSFLRGQTGRFNQISSWQQEDPNDTSFSKSTDGLWWYNHTTEFHDNESKLNPQADMSKIFSLYLMGDAEAVAASNPSAKAKLDWMDDFFAGWRARS